MKAIFKVLHAIVTLALIVWIFLTAYDTLYDVWLYWGVIGVIVGIVIYPVTMIGMPLILMFNGYYGMAIGTYIILPVLGFCYSATKSSVE